MVKFDSTNNSPDERDNKNTVLCHRNDIVLDNLVLFILDEPDNDFTQQQHVNGEHILSWRNDWYHATPKIMFRRHLNGVEKNKKHIQVVLAYMRDQLIRSDCSRIDRWKLET